MKRKPTSRKELLSSCYEVGPGDGIDPRTSMIKNDAVRPNLKSLRLCAEVAKTLSHVLAWEMGDDLLGRLLVESVVPAPNASRLLVTVSLQLSEEDPAAEIRERLHKATGKLRSEIAAAIDRRRTPELAFSIEIRGGPTR